VYFTTIGRHTLAYNGHNTEGFQLQQNNGQKHLSACLLHIEVITLASECHCHCAARHEVTHQHVVII